VANQRCERQGQRTVTALVAATDALVSVNQRDITSAKIDGDPKRSMPGAEDANLMERVRVGLQSLNIELVPTKLEDPGQP
jgi:hypothetical protein